MKELEFQKVGNKGYAISKEMDISAIDAVAQYARDNGLTVLDLPFTNLVKRGDTAKFKLTGKFNLLQLTNETSALLLAKVESGQHRGSVQMAVEQFKSFSAGDDIYIRLVDIADTGRKIVEFQREPFKGSSVPIETKVQTDELKPVF